MPVANLQSLLTGSSGAVTLSSDQQNIVNSVINLFVKSVSARYTTDRIPQIIPFVQNPNNAAAILAAYTVYGNPANQSFSTQAEFYYFAYYSSLYPLPAAVQTNCTVLSSQETSLQAELAGSDKVYVSDNNAILHNIRTTVIIQMLSNVQAMYANLNCDTYIVATQNTADQAAQLQQVKATTTSTSNLGIYFLIGSGVLVAILVMIKIFKHKNNSK